MIELRLLFAGCLFSVDASGCVVAVLPHKLADQRCWMDGWLQNATPGVSDGDVLVPDTNIVLHHLELLENPLIDNVVLLKTVIDEASPLPRLHAPVISFSLLASPCHSFSSIGV